MTIKKCIKCGATERYASGACRPCASEYRAKFHADNPTYGANYRAANAENIRTSAANYQSLNTEKIRERRAKYRVDNPEKVEVLVAAAAKWKAENPERVAAATANWRAANKDHLIAYSVTYRAENKEKCSKSCSKWQSANQDKRRIYEHNRRARKLAAGGKLSNGLADKLFKLQKGKCPCCKQPLGDDYHLDHIMPLALGGSNHDANIQLLRQRCNNQKYSKHPVDFMQSRGFLI